MNPRSVLTISLLVLLLITSVMALYLATRTPKIGFVVLREVFEEFQFKKEIQSKYEVVKNAKKKLLDSLQVDLSVLNKRIEISKPSESDLVLFERKKIEFNQRLQQFEEENQHLINDWDKQIIKQLNKFIEEFARKNGYQLLLGSDSNGNIMFGEERHNCTKEAIEYVNARYSGLD